MSGYGLRPINYYEKELTWELHNIFGNNHIKNETVMFIDKGDIKSLLYEIDKILSVSSYDGKIIYKEGVDYELVSGKIKITEKSTIPCITSDKYYNGDGTLKTLYNGEMTPTHWGEGRVMTDYQVNVEYTHNDVWRGYKQPCYANLYDTFYKKLENGDNVTILFYGDSCTYGAASSFAYGYPPFQYSYALLVTNAIADIYGYKVRYIKPNLEGTGPVPPDDYNKSFDKTITYINPSVGGWTTKDGVEKFELHAKPFIEKYGCDLFIVDLGGNDGPLPPENTRDNVAEIISKALSLSKDTCVTIISTLLNRPGSNWAGNDALEEPFLLTLSEKLRDEGTPCSLCGISSMTASVLEKIKFEDFSGNNINHPNDFWARLYACTLFETLIGYKNLL